MEIIGLREHDDMDMSDNDREVREPERGKKKLVNDNDGLVPPQSMELVLHILGGFGIDKDDEDEDGASLKRRHYCTCVTHWMEPDKGYYTREAQAAWNNPRWNQLYCIPIIENIPGDYGFLYVEVARLYSETDPGTSSGTVIVGRAKVPLPREPYKEVKDWFDLARPNGDGHMCFAGEIFLGMTLRERKYMSQE
ncbi:hypothetical protein QN277_015796 [Acacia crassicarpa]|uniref:C2 domain-containing protein n=1 Tax=Acacia crassicarpa TaxID=499986 RepID=A0AAE1JWL3_9FABA|nr:hypothetical protein QN277_015796 [Acacia crassicarpa]